jgi:ribonuclease P protein component
MSLPRARILRARRDFAEVREAGRPKVGRFLLLTAIADPAGPDAATRFGFITPRYVGKAHDRTLVRRRLRDIVKHLSAGLRPGFRVVTLARRGAAGAAYADLAAEWRRLAGKAGLLAPPPPARPLDQP